MMVIRPEVIEKGRDNSWTYWYDKGQRYENCEPHKTRTGIHINTQYTYGLGLAGRQRYVHEGRSIEQETAASVC